MASEKPEFVAAKPEDWEQRLKEKEMDLASGFLGRFFGVGDNAASNIVGVVCVASVILSVALPALLLFLRRQTRN